MSDPQFNISHVWYLPFIESTDDEGSNEDARKIGYKYKTEMCKNFSETGVCPYFEKCQFAHGFEELHPQKSETKLYKTKKCKSFWEDGACSYGNRCQFLHNITKCSEDFPETELNCDENFLKVVYSLYFDCSGGWENFEENNFEN